MFKTTVAKVAGIQAELRAIFSQVEEVPAGSRFKVGVWNAKAETVVKVARDMEGAALEKFTVPDSKTGGRKFKPGKQKEYETAFKDAWENEVEVDDLPLTAADLEKLLDSFKGVPEALCSVLVA